MKPALGYRQPHYPKSWQALPNGGVIVDEINRVLTPWWPKFFGYHLLKIGALSLVTAHMFFKIHFSTRNNALTAL